MKRAIVALGLALGAYPFSFAAAEAPASQFCPNPRSEVFVPAGHYTPFYKRAGKRTLPVGPMCVGSAPVTNAQYLDFVRQHPEWRKSQVDKIFAEDRYLAEWSNDLTPPADALAAPVTFVSWFAADAFCEAHGARLPKIAEWERFAGAQLAEVPVAGNDGAAPFAFAMGQRAPDLAHTPLKLAGIWEWTEDFNSAVVAARAGSSKEGSASLFCGDGYRSVDPTNYATFLRYSFRSSLHADFALRNLGFRCAHDAT